MCFEEDKRAQLAQTLGLRVINAIGMVNWKTNYYNDAIPMIRLLHPVTWVWLIVIIIIATFLDGFPRTIKSAREFIREETVWL